jgi:hypothetical protein
MPRVTSTWLLLAVAALILWPSSARAQQTDAGIAELEVALWPEFDQPAVLVIYHFRLKPGSTLPARVAVPIPATVGEPHAVAWRNEDGSLLVAEFTRLVEDERAMVLMKMGGLEGQLEFYANLAIAGRNRSYRFSWPGGIQLDTLSYQVQRPLGTSRFDVFPAPDRQTLGSDGLTYLRADLGPQDAEARPTIDLSYERDTARLTANTRPSDQPESRSGGNAQGGKLLPWLLGGFGGLLLGLAVSLYLWSSARRAEVSSPGRSRTRKERSEKTTDKDGAPLYCHSCGTKALAGDGFCRNCGTRLRR